MTDTDDEILQRVRRVIDVVRAEPDPRPPTQLPGFRLLAKLGVGGMGVVWEAEQEHPRRRVALKMIRQDRSSASALRRFEYEAEVLARLQHPGIAQIHATGTFAGSDGPQPFLAMELVDGVPLLDYAHAHRLNRDQRLELLVAICHAVHHAHQKGVIHRDLKPSNILVTGIGQPKVLDFGVARLTDQDGASLLTVAGQLVGTVPYMSPEQVRADPDDIDVRTDVYTLGVVGFELLTGRLPYDVAKKPATEVVRTVSEHPPARLGAIVPALRGDLDIVFAKALEKDRDRRYQSAAEFALDVERFLRGEPIAARAPTTAYQLRKFVGRHRALVGFAGLTLLSLVVGTVVSTWQMWRARDAEATAELRRTEAEREARLSTATTEYLRLILDSHAPSEPGRPPTVLDAIDHAARGLGELDDPLVEAAICDIVGSTYTTLGRFDIAEKYLDRALTLLSAHRKPPHEEIARCLNQLGRLDTMRGDQERAEARFRRSLAMYVELHGPEHELVGRSLDNLSATLHHQAKATNDKVLLGEARELVERAIAIARRSRRHWLATALAGLGSIQREQNDPAATATLTEALEVFDSTPYARDPMAAIARINLGCVLYARSEFASAEALFQQAFEMCRERLGDDHAYTRGAKAWVDEAAAHLRTSQDK